MELLETEEDVPGFEFIGAAFMEPKGTSSMVFTSPLAAADGLACAEPREFVEPLAQRLDRLATSPKRGLANVDNMRPGHPFVFEPLDRYRRVLAFEPACRAWMDERRVGLRRTEDNVRARLAWDLGEVG